VSAYDTAVRPSWREEARQDRAARARLDMERDAARAAARIAGQEAAQMLKREADADRRRARAQAAEDRSARLAALGGWVTRHVTDLLFVPVIGVPALLAWTAMSAYGAHLYGPAGRALPAFSEGAMWAFAAAVTITGRRRPGRPVWHLRLGTVVVAAFGAALNFAHGLTLGGSVTGAVMALVSVAGVTAHQPVTAGPRRARRTRADRDADRIARLTARRVRKAREEAVKAAAVELAADGAARLVLAVRESEVAPTPAMSPGAETVAVDAPVDVPTAEVPTVPGPMPRTVTAPRPRTRAAGRAPKSPEKVFSAELGRGEIPSLRSVKARMNVGSDKARIVLADLRTALNARPEVSEAA
jgi:hypothetical protein